MPMHVPVSPLAKANCCGVCRYHSANARCFCADVDDNPVVPQYVASLAQALQNVLQTNDSEPATVAASLRCFQGRSIPPISVRDYIQRIAKYSKCSPVCFIMAWSYLKRVCGKEHIELAVTSLTVHRLVICSVLLAVKMTDDRYYNNAFFAKIGGITVTELNTMELEMLKLLGFRTHVPPSEIKWLLSRLKSLQGPGPVTSVLCKRRIIRSVDDLPTLKQREVEPEMQSANITSGSLRPAEQIGVLSAASRSLSCQLSLSSVRVPATVHDTACSPLNGLSLPKLCVGNQQCSLQHNKSKAFPDNTSSIEVTV